MEELFARLGRMVARRRGAVVAAWVVLLAGGAVLAPGLQSVFEREFVSGSTGDSQRAATVISSEFRGRGAYQEQLVLRSSSYTVDDRRYRRAAGALIAAAEASGRIRSVESYFNTGDRMLVSADRRTTYALLNLRSRTHADGMNSSGKIIDRVAAAPKPSWLRGYVTGEEATHADLMKESRSGLARAELVGVPVALVILIVVFGALVAASLPLLVGVTAIVIALGLAFIVGQFRDLSVFLENFAVMLGLGVGIDYSLLMLTRYRQERGAGGDVPSAVVEAVTHAGKAIAFSGLAVMIGLTSLFATGDPVLSSMAIGGVLVVLAAVAAALTLLPAALTWLGDRIEFPRRLARLVRRPGGGGGFWRRWAMGVMRRPATFALLAVVLVAGLAWPLAGIKTGALGSRALEASAQSRQGFETMAREFGAGVVSPVQIVIQSRDGIADPRTLAGVERLTRAIAADRRFAGAASITTLLPGATAARYSRLYAERFEHVPARLRPALAPLVNLDRRADTTIVRGFLAQEPSASASEAAVRDLRHKIVPAIPELRGERVLVGGATALDVDSREALYRRLPLVAGLILGTTLVLLLVLFRSVLIPLAAVAMNLPAVLAATGALVLVFQHGVGDSLLGFQAVGRITWITPVLIFGVLFGLSMDYQVFLLSRMRELRDRGHTTEQAIALGVERTAGVIAGAAAIMVVVFASFTLTPIIPLKELGFALAVAVLVDATVIRLLLVPAIMRLLGDRSWWLPHLPTRTSRRTAAAR